MDLLGNSGRPLWSDNGGSHWSEICTQTASDLAMGGGGGEIRSSDGSIAPPLFLDTWVLVGPSHPNPLCTPNVDKCCTAIFCCFPLQARPDKMIADFVILHAVLGFVSLASNAMNQRIAKGAGKKVPRENCRKVSKNFLTLFDDF